MARPLGVALVLAMGLVQSTASTGGDSGAALHESRSAPPELRSEPAPGPYLRPLDDSDPEMRDLLNALFDLTPCGSSAHGICDSALGLLTGGSDRLAAYLIVQFERSLAEGDPNRGTYLRLLGHTESATAFDYLTALVQERADAYETDESDPLAHQDLVFAIEGLGRTRAREVSGEALALFGRFEDPAIRIRAVNAFDRVQAKYGPDPETADRFRAVYESRQGSPRTREPVGEDEWLEKRMARVLAEPGHTFP